MRRVMIRSICNQNGVALIIVILMISIIVTLTIRLNRDMRSEVYDAVNLSDQIRLRYVAESGIYAGEALLLADKNQFDALTEDWAKTEILSLRSEEFFDNASFKLLIEDEGGKIQINSLVDGNNYNPVVRDMLLRLLTGPHFRLDNSKAEEIVDSVKDWIDTDKETTGRGKDGMVKNAKFDCIEELLMIKGVSRELFFGSDEFFGLINCMTVFGDGKININTAPEPVVRALSAQMTKEESAKFDEHRRDENNTFADPGWYSRIPQLTGLNIPAGLTTIKSDTFRITADGINGKMTERIVAIVKREADRRKINILSWRVD